MELIFLVLAIASLFTTLLSLKKSKVTEMRLHEVSSLTSEALQDIDGLMGMKKTVESIDHAANQEALTSRILNVRNNLERRIRRICLFTKDKRLVSASLLWFSENSTPEDKAYISRALKFKYIRDRDDRQLAEGIIKNSVSAESNGITI